MGLLLQLMIAIYNFHQPYKLLILASVFKHVELREPELRLLDSYLVFLHKGVDFILVLDERSICEKLPKSGGVFEPG